MSWKGDLLKAGISSDGLNVDVFRGDLTVYGNITFTGGATITGGIAFGSRTSGSGTDLGTYETGVLVAVQYEDAAALANTTDYVGCSAIFNLHLNRAITLAAGGGYGWAGIWSNVEIDANINQTGGTSAAWLTLWMDGTSAIAGSSRLQGLDIALVSSGSGQSFGASTELYGIRLDSSINASTTVSGAFAAINIEADGAKKDWTQGINISGATTPIYIGACTTGINLAGAMTDGIIIGGTASDNSIEITGVATGAGILIDYTIPGADGRALHVDCDTAETTGDVECMVLAYTNSAAGINNMRAFTSDLVMGAGCNGPYAGYFRTDCVGNQVGGLGAALGTEVCLPGATLASGEFHNITLDFECAASFSTGTGGKHSFIKFEIWGNSPAKTVFDDAFNLFFLNGMTSASGNLVSAGEQTLRINIEGTSRYLMLSHTEDYLDIGSTSAYGVDLTGVFTTVGIRAIGQTAECMQLVSTMTLSNASRNCVKVSAISPANADYELRAIYAECYPSDTAQATTGCIAGYFEARSTLNIDFVKGVIGSVNCDAAKTIATGSAGVFGVVNVANATTVSAGALSAGWFRVLGAAALDGILNVLTVDMDMSVDAGIDFDVADAMTCTVGIELGGTTAGKYGDGILISAPCDDNAIEITGACTDSAIQVTGICTAGLFKAGVSDGSLIDLGSPAIATNWVGVGIFGTLTGATGRNAGGSYPEDHGINVVLHEDGEVQFMYAIQARAYADDSGVAQEMFGLYGRARVESGGTVGYGSNGQCIGVYGLCYLKSGGTLDVGGSGVLAGGRFSYKDQGATHSTSGVKCAIMAEVEEGTPDCVMYVLAHAGAGTIPSAIDFNNAGTDMTNLFKFRAATGFIDTSGHGAGAGGRIKCDVAGATRYIYLYTN